MYKNRYDTTTPSLPVRVRGSFTQQAKRNSKEIKQRNTAEKEVKIQTKSNREIRQKKNFKQTNAIEGRFLYAEKWARRSINFRLRRKVVIISRGKKNV